MCDPRLMATLLRKDFDDFLFTLVGKDADGTPVTLLTVLARLGIDPWEEAADLAHLSREPAMQRLASRLEAMPNRPASAADTVTLVSSLIALLHRAPPRKAPLPQAPLPEATSTEAPSLQRAAKQAKRVPVAIYWLMGVLLVMVVQWALSSRPAQPPMDTTIATGSRK
jgi:hypothetical protein